MGKPPALTTASRLDSDAPVAKPTTATGMSAAAKDAASAPTSASLTPRTRSADDHGLILRAFAEVGRLPVGGEQFVDA